MGLTDIFSTYIFTTNYKDVKAAYETLRKYVKHGVLRGDEADPDKNFKEKITTALVDTVKAIDIELWKRVNGSTLGEKDTHEAATARRVQFDNLIKAQAEALLQEYNKLLNARSAKEGLLHQPDQKVFKKRKTKIIEHILPRFFKNFCRELNTFIRTVFGMKTRTHETLVDFARVVVKETNSNLKRDVSAQAKKVLIDGANAVGSAAARLARTAVQAVSGKGSTPPPSSTM